MDLWDHILNDGYDEIVYIPMSSSLSGSCHNAAQGKSAREIKEYLETVAYQSSIYLTVSSLKYLKKVVASLLQPQLSLISFT